MVHKKLFVLFLGISIASTQIQASLLEKLAVTAGGALGVGLWQKVSDLNKKILFLEELEQHLGQKITEDLFDDIESDIYVEAKKFAKNEEKSKFFREIIKNKKPFASLKTKKYLIQTMLILDIVITTGIISKDICIPLWEKLAVKFGNKGYKTPEGLSELGDDPKKDPIPTIYPTPPSKKDGNDNSEEPFPRVEFDSPFEIS